MPATLTVDKRKLWFWKIVQCWLLHRVDQKSKHVQTTNILEKSWSRFYKVVQLQKPC